MGKVCNICGVNKPIEEFYIRKDSKDGRRNDCIVCHRKNKQIYSQKNSEQKKSYMRQYRIDNPDSIKLWQKKNPDKYYGGIKKWKNENPEKVRIHKSNQQKRRKSKDPKYRLKGNIRRLILQSITRGGYSKKTLTNEILGIDYEGFYKHIENQFTNGMTWDNRGLWELDHKVPVSLGKTEEEIIKLNHYTNFQPLWRKDNIIKSDKVLPEFNHLVKEYIL